MDCVGLDFKRLIRALRQIERAHNIIVATDPAKLSEADNLTRTRELESHAKIYSAVWEGISAG